MLTRVEPVIRIELETIRPDAADPRSAGRGGQFRVAWRVHNGGAEALGLEDAWVPHGRFRGTDGHVPLASIVEAGESARVELGVATSEPPGTVVNNAFLILRAQRGPERWRIFARMRVEFDAAAQPRPIVEQVTAQSIQ
jgi:hypothetical protein